MNAYIHAHMHAHMHARTCTCAHTWICDVLMFVEWRCWWCLISQVLERRSCLCCTHQPAKRKPVTSPITKQPHVRREQFVRDPFEQPIGEVRWCECQKNAKVEREREREGEREGRRRKFGHTCRNTLESLSGRHGGNGC